jgi:hypothetical protein
VKARNPTYPATKTTVTIMAATSPPKLRSYRLGRSGAGSGVAAGCSFTAIIFTGDP